MTTSQLEALARANLARLPYLKPKPSLPALLLLLIGAVGRLSAAFAARRSLCSPLEPSHPRFLSAQAAPGRLALHLGEIVLIADQIATALDLSLAQAVVRAQCVASIMAGAPPHPKEPCKSTQNS
jgi:hypothetical protein